MQLDIKPDWRTTVAALSTVLVAVLAVLATVYVSGQQLDEAHDANEKQLAVTERGQITDRFGKAVDQLGQEDQAPTAGQAAQSRLSIRLGGIYALERIMNDSLQNDSQEVYEDTITEVLSAYIRAHAVSETPSGTPPTDLQAALTVLSRRPDPATHRHIDLSGETHLEGVRLPDAHLEGANLEKADLGGAVMPRGHFAGAILTCAHLTDVDLSTADGLTSEQVSLTVVNPATKLPAGVDRPAADAEATCKKAG